MSTEDLPEEQEDKDKGALSEDTPRFRRPEQRKEVAVAKYYGMGSDDEWELEEIAEYLNVTVSAVKNYLESEMGERAREMFPEAEARLQMDILMELKDRLEQVRDIRRGLMEKKKMVPTQFETEQGQAELSFEDHDGAEKPSGEDAPRNYVSLHTPVVKKFSEVTEFDNELQAVLREERLIEEEIRDFLSLDEPDEVKTQHTGDAVVEQKVYQFDGMGDFPEAEVVETEAELVEPDEEVNVVEGEE